MYAGKRHYQSGYYIDWKNNSKNTAVVRTRTDNLDIINAKKIDQSQLSASTNEDIILTSSKLPMLLLSKLKATIMLKKHLKKYRQSLQLKIKSKL